MPPEQPYFVKLPFAEETKLSSACLHTLFDYYNPDASVTIAPDRFTVEAKNYCTQKTTGVQQQGCRPESAVAKALRERNHPSIAA